MRSILVPSLLCALGAAVSAQTYTAMPANSNLGFELSGFSLVPFMQPNARVQAFYDFAETGNPLFTADQLSLRFDGPIPQVGAPGPFSITRFQIRVGVSNVAAPTAQFATNLSQPLTTVFDAPISYLPDPGSASPHPWGGTNDTLTFNFTSPVTIAMAPGDWLVVEMVMEGNDIASFGFSHAIVDGNNASGGLTNGTAAAFGTGCSASVGAPAATCTTSGLYGPGGAHFLTGQNLGANTIGVAAFGFTSFPVGTTLPGTNCGLLVDPQLLVPFLTDAAGAVGGTTLALSFPADPVFNGGVLYEQLATLVPTANPLGLVTSNAQTVTFGSWTTPTRGFYTVSHDSNATAAFANAVRPFGFAVRFRTL